MEENSTFASCSPQYDVFFHLTPQYIVALWRLGKFFREVRLFPLTNRRSAGML
jgi:hypothetical protein